MPVAVVAEDCMCGKFIKEESEKQEEQQLPNCELEEVEVKVEWRRERKKETKERRLRSSTQARKRTRS